MEVICQNCNAKLSVVDEKLPAGQLVFLKCSRCEKKIPVDTRSNMPENPETKGLETIVREVDSKAYDASEKPFDYLVEGEIIALLCEQEPKIRQGIGKILKSMNYRVVEAVSARNALKYMRFHTYNLVVVNEMFEAPNADSNHIIQYLAQLPISVRRDVFVVLFGKSFRTMDSMIAFNKSVNLVVNVQDLGDIAKILNGALTDHEHFYHVFKESAKKAGHA